LADLLIDHGETVPQVFLSLSELTDFAVQFRYEAYDDMSGELDRIQITRRVSELVDHVSRLLESWKMKDTCAKIEKKR